MKTAWNVVLKRLTAIAERYIIYFNFVFLFAGGLYQDSNYLLSSRKDHKNWVNSKMSS